MRQFIDLLTESATDYKMMINPVLAAINAPSGDRISHDISAKVADKINAQWVKQIALAKSLRKADRITWYLRLCRMSIINAFQKALDPTKINKIKQEYTQRTGSSFESDDFSIETAQYSDSIHNLEHYLSLPILGIQNYQFRFQSYNQVISDFQTFEDKWKETVKNSIEDNESKVIIDCGNDWYWVNTEKASCDKEAAAMGHCGNSPRSGSSDNLLSLRKKIMMGDDVRWEPHLTFILASDGYLTEMKGRGNDKPTEKYFPMIVKLLESDYVKGIRGGGYLPENNFSIDDLDKVTRERLITEKPELGTIYDLFTEYGVSDVVFDRLVEALDQYRLTVLSYTDDGVILIDNWDDIERFFRNGLYNDNWVRIADIAEGSFDGWMDFNDDTEILEAIFESDAADEEDLTDILAQKMGCRPENVINSLLHIFPKSVSAIWDEVRSDIKKNADAECREYIRKLPLQCSDLDISIEDGSVRLTCDFNNMVHNISNYQQGDYEYTNGFEYCAKEREWLTINDENDWDAPDDEIEDADGFYRKADELAVRLLKELFANDDQMSFDF